MRKDTFALILICLGVLAALFVMLGTMEGLAIKQAAVVRNCEIHRGYVYLNREQACVLGRKL